MLNKQKSSADNPSVDNHSADNHLVDNHVVDNHLFDHSVGDHLTDNHSGNIVLDNPSNENDVLLKSSRETLKRTRHSSILEDECTSQPLSQTRRVNQLNQLNQLDELDELDELDQSERKLANSHSKLANDHPQNPSIAKQNPANLGNPCKSLSQFRFTEQSKTAPQRQLLERQKQTENGKKQGGQTGEQPMNQIRRESAKVDAKGLGSCQGYEISQSIRKSSMKNTQGIGQIDRRLESNRLQNTNNLECSTSNSREECGGERKNKDDYRGERARNSSNRGGEKSSCGEERVRNLLEGGGKKGSCREERGRSLSERPISRTNSVEVGPEDETNDEDQILGKEEGLGGSRHTNLIKGSEKLPSSLPSFNCRRPGRGGHSIGGQRRSVLGRILPGPAGKLQKEAFEGETEEKNCRESNQQEEEGERSGAKNPSGFDDNVSSFDDDFKSGPWLTALDMLDAQPLTNPGDPWPYSWTSIGFIRQSGTGGRVDRVVGFVSSFELNGLGGAYITLKDPSGSITATIPMSVLGNEALSRDLSCGAVIILKAAIVFSPLKGIQNLNITKENVVQVFGADTPLPPSPPSEPEESAPMVPSFNLFSSIVPKGVDN